MTQLLITQSTEGSAAEFVDRRDVELDVFHRFSAGALGGVPLEPMRPFRRLMSMPIALPAGPTLGAASNTSSPPPQPRSTTTSPGRRFAVAMGLPHDNPMLASAGIDANSSAE